MSKKILLECKNLNKTYSIYLNLFFGLICDLFSKKNIFKKKINALRNINFKIHSGDRVGILGLNGSGKSTLFSCIAGLTNITSGRIKLFGDIELNSSNSFVFSEYFSGKENIIINQISNGYSYKSANQSLDEIIKFSELENYIENPYYTYSQGMKSRLLVSMSLFQKNKKNIFLFDESLSASDFTFYEKVTKKLIEISKERNKSVMIASHDLNIIKKVCNKIIILDKGRLKSFGSASFVLKEYKKLN